MNGVKEQSMDVAGNVSLFATLAHATLAKIMSLLHTSD